LDDALVLYVRGRCGEVTTEMLDNPDYRKVTDEAAWFVFRHSTNDYADSKEAHDFMNRFVGDRPITVPLLRSAFAEWKQSQASEEEQPTLARDQAKTEQTRGRISEAALDRLSDEQVANIYRGAVREGAQQEINYRKMIRGE